MVRIKGANSDYRYDLDSEQIQEVKPPPNPLHLNLYICPYDMPSPIEAPKDGEWCDGRDATCPHPNASPGHALVQLHQADGISLVTDHDNQLVVDQTGHIRLEPGQGKVLIGKADHARLHIQQTQHGWEIQLANGPRLHLTQDGNLHLIPGQSGQVHIQGALKVDAGLQVSGALTCQSLTVQGATQSSLATRLAALETRLQTLEAAQ